MLNKKIEIFFFVLISFCLFSCSDDDTLDEELEIIIENYVEDSVNKFIEEIDTLGGFAGWKNYKDFAGLGEEKFKERLKKTWLRNYDSETLEFIINLKLSQNNIKEPIKLKKGDEYIDIYMFSLISPVIEELLFSFILFLFGMLLTLVVGFFTIGWLGLLILIAVLILMYFTDRKNFNRIILFFKYLPKILFYGTIISIGIIIYFFFFEFNEIIEYQLKKEIISDIKIELNNSKIS